MSWTRSNHRNHLPRDGSARRGVVLLLLVHAMALAPMAVRAETVPAQTQLPIVFKLLTYERTIWADPPDRLRIGVLHRPDDPASQANLTDIVAALTASSAKTINGVPFDFTAIGWTGAEDLAAGLDSAAIDVLYVTAGHEKLLDPVLAATVDRGILTVAAREAYVADGLAVGLGTRDGRPQIVVNLAALAASGHQLDARVLRLCRVVDR